MKNSKSSFVFKISVLEPEDWNVVFNKYFHGVRELKKFDMNSFLSEFKKHYKSVYHHPIWGKRK